MEFYTIEQSARGDWHVRSSTRGIVVEHVSKPTAIKWAAHGNNGGEV